MRPRGGAVRIGICSSVLIAAGLSCTAAEMHASSTPTTTPREWHVAQCVAALELQAESLAAQAKTGDEAKLPLLLSRLELAAAFVGDNYLHGDGDDDQARALLDQARSEQKQLSLAQVAARQNVCADEGAHLLARANGLQRMVVKRLAKRRMDRLLRS